VLDVRTGKLRWHRQLVPNDSHDWDVTHATPLFSATVNGTTRRLVATTGKDGVLRALDRETHEIMFETPVTTRENADTPVTPAGVCPGVLEAVSGGPAYNPDECASCPRGLVRDVLGVRAGPLHPRRSYMAATGSRSAYQGSGGG
jgi:hypothetical protein